MCTWWCACGALAAGTVITKIHPGGLAESTGAFRVGDTIVRINGVRRCFARRGQEHRSAVRGDRSPWRLSSTRSVSQTSIVGWASTRVMTLVKSLVDEVTFVVVHPA